MNETSIITKIRNLFQKPIVRDICIVVFIGIFLYSFCRTAEYVYTNWFGRTNHNRAIDAVEQGKKSNESSIELNRLIQSEIDRSTILNHEAERRIEQIEVYQREASERIDESKARLDEARRLLESNQQIFRDCEQGNPAIKENGGSTP